MRDRGAFHSTYAWKRLRKLVKLSAGYRCQRCGEVLTGKGQLHIHHIKKVDEHPAVRLEPLNCVCLCSPCHNQIEVRSGSPRPTPACDVQGYALDRSHPWHQGGGSKTD